MTTATTSHERGIPRGVPRRLMTIAATLSLLTGLVAAASMMIAAPNAAAQDVATQEAQTAEPEGRQTLPPIPVYDDDRVALEKAKSLWASQEPDSYTYGYREVCFCPFRGSIEVVVEDGLITKATDANGVPVADPLTIEDMYQVVRTAIERPANSLSASYDAAYGYPTQIDVDLILAPIDGHYGIVMESFVDQDQDNAREEWNEAIRLWADKEPSLYSYTYLENCFCPTLDEITVVVSNQEVIAAYGRFGQDVPNPLTIADMFDRISNAIDLPADVVVADYDATYGYPTNFFIDQSLMIADEEYGVTMQSFLDRDPLAAELGAAEALWSESNPGAYRYTYRPICFCFPTGLITVTVDEQGIGAVDEAGNIIEDPFLIGDMFDYLADALTGPLASYSATYNAAYGYPENFFVDPYVGIADGGFGIAVESFEALESPAILVDYAKSCLNEDGRFDFVLTSQALVDGPVDYILNVGTVERTVTLLSGAPDTETVTGRPDGSIALSVSQAEAPFSILWSVPEFVACDPPSPEVEILSSCLAENGRIDVLINNPALFFPAIFPAPPIPLDEYTVTFGSLKPRDVLVPAGAPEQRVTTTGRPEGPLRVLVQKNGESIEAVTVVVDCDPDPGGTSVSVSCLAGNGRVDVYVYNDVSDVRAEFTVLVGTIERTVEVFAGQTQRETVTGRPDGPLGVTVMYRDQILLEAVVTVSCDR